MKILISSNSKNQHNSISKVMCMTLRQAQALCQKDIHSMSLEELQKHRVKLLDAYRESNLEYGEKEAYENGFLVPFEDVSGKGFIPKDKFLTTNLKWLISETEKLIDKELNSFGWGVYEYDEDDDEEYLIYEANSERSCKRWISKNYPDSENITIRRK